MGSLASSEDCGGCHEEDAGRSALQPIIRLCNLELMKYLIKLVTPTGGTVYDPFAGSGTTLIAAKELGFDSFGVEMSEEYCKIIKDRIDKVTSPLEQLL